MKLLQLQTVDQGKLDTAAESQRNEALNAALHTAAPSYWPAYVVMAMGIAGAGYACATAKETLCAAGLGFVTGSIATVTILRW